MSNDNKIKQYRNKIEAKREKLGKKPRASYETNGQLQLDDSKVNLNTIQTIEQCVFYAGTIVSVMRIAERGNEVLEADIVPKFGDYTCEQVLNDLKVRASIIRWDEEKKKLDVMEKQLQSLMSENAKTAEAIADIASQLED